MRRALQGRKEIEKGVKAWVSAVFMFRIYKRRTIYLFRRFSKADASEKIGAIVRRDAHRRTIAFPALAWVCKCEYK